MTELLHTRKDCTTMNICLGGINGLFCGNCGAGLPKPTNCTDCKALSDVSLQDTCDGCEDEAL